MADNKPVPKKKQTPAGKKNAFLDKVRGSKAVSAAESADRGTLARALETTGRPRLLFTMDATASREPSWQLAQQITGAMFEAVPGALDVALAWHGGGRLQTRTAFSDDARVFLDTVHSVTCQAGPTALGQILEDAVNIHPRLKALIYIGDCFEEDAGAAQSLARQLKLKNVRCFMFHEEREGCFSPYAGMARDVFGMIAGTTGGALLPFDETAPERVKELLEAIAVYAVGGIRLLEQRQKALPAAKMLLEQMGRGSGR